MSMLTLGQAPPGRSAPGRSAPGRSAPRRFDWPSPAAVPRLPMIVGFAGSAAFAVTLAMVTVWQAHRLWGIFAGISYLLAAISVLVWKSRGLDVALVVTLAGALVTPMWLMAGHRLQQPEVQVIDQSAAMLMHRGTPYPGPAMLAAAHNPNIFDPYLPAMTAFGIPRVLLGVSPVTDPRIWFGAGFIVVFAAALAVAGARDVVRWTALVTASPFIAFSLAVGGTDVPVLACVCLGFALLWRRPRPVLAGLALGAAAVMKATAWPALLVAAVLLAARDGRRAAVSMSATALLLVAAVVGPVAAIGPRSLVQNTIAFPLGLASVKSDAVSPLPGRLLAETGYTGHLVAVALLVLAGLAVIASLALRPPGSVPAAAGRLIIALTAMFVLAPATRFGYFVYPVGLLAWLEVSRMGRASAAAPEGPPGSGPGGLADSGTEGGPGDGAARSANPVRQEAYH